MRKRRASRELALQILYALDIQGKIGELSAEELMQETLIQLHHLSPEIKNPGSDLSYLLVSGVINQIETIDLLIENASDNWTLERFPAIDRNILRIAVFEINYVEDVPARVAINEAIEIAKDFATNNSPKFINGVLDRIYRIMKRKAGGNQL